MQIQTTAAISVGPVEALLERKDLGNRDRSFFRLALGVCCRLLIAKPAEFSRSGSRQARPNDLASEHHIEAQNTSKMKPPTSSRTKEVCDCGAQRREGRVQAFAQVRAASDLPLQRVGGVPVPLNGMRRDGTARHRPRRHACVRAGGRRLRCSFAWADGSLTFLRSAKFVFCRS